MRTCEVNGCANKHYSKGYCSKHRQRLANTGKLTIDILPDICSVSGCNGARRRLGFCHKHYYRYHRHGSTDATIIVGDDKRRLLNNCKKSDSGCWEWQKSKYSGYGKTFIKGKGKQAHRASWEIFVGDIPKGMQVNHKCHNRSCINPDHLYIGTQKENMKDMYDAGRDVKKKGSENGASKLDESKVRIIKNMLSSGNKISAISKKFGVSESCIRFIKQDKTWRHVNG